MNNIMAAASGLLFALGLALSGMTSPRRIIGFLDVLGDWDPRLAFVMGGAVGTYAVLHQLIRRRFPKPLLAPRYQVPGQRRPDARLVAGAALFGVGWGMLGLCPGPALVSLGAGEHEALVFTGAMAAGMLLASLWLRRRSLSSSATSEPA
jgi:uncharacterized protein